MKTKNEQTQDFSVTQEETRQKLPTQLLPRLLPLFMTSGDAVSKPLQVFLNRKQTPPTRYIHGPHTRQTVTCVRLLHTC